MASIRVATPQRRLRGQVAELSAEIDGVPVWFEYPSEFSPVVDGDAFLCTTLLPAMHARQPLQVDAGCSGLLLGSARGPLQDIFTGWFPDLGRVDVTAPTADAVADGRHVGAFFSGGVDSVYTVLRNQASISHLISVHGLDVPLDASAAWAEVETANRDMANVFGLPLVTVRTNVREWANPRHVSWNLHHASVLAAIAHAMGLARGFVAASNTYHTLFAWGSHPLVDPLWSSGAVAVVHDGCARRTEKVRRIAMVPELLTHLRVCFQNKGYNCGVCTKCLRTRVTLTLLGLSTPSLPTLRDYTLITRSRIFDWLGAC